MAEILLYTWPQEDSLLKPKGTYRNTQKKNSKFQDAVSCNPMYFKRKFSPGILLLMK